MLATGHREELEPSCLSPCFPTHLASSVTTLLLLLCRSDSVGHSGPLGLSQPSLSSLFPPSSRFHLSLIPVGLSDPLGYLLYTLELPPLPSSLFFAGSSSWGSKVTRCSPSRFHRSLLYLIKSTDWLYPWPRAPTQITLSTGKSNEQV